jgi:hypothetical protein
MKKARKARKPTRDQKEKIKKAGLDWGDWLVKYEDNISLALESKTTGEIQVILT